MRVIVWGINYSPELTGIAPFNTGLCDHLKSQGHNVEMVTSFPYYPSWKKNEGDRGKLYRKDDFDGVPVHRCWHYVPPRVTTLRRILHEVTFGIVSLFRVLALKAADVYVIVSPPLILGPLASLVCAIKSRPYVFHVQDLQPDAAVGLGMVKAGTLTRLLYWIEGWSYRHAAAVSGISNGMMNAFTRKGVPAHKQWLSPNWIRWHGRNAALELAADEREERAKRFRGKYAIPHDVFLASYSGNLGRKQGLETLVEAAAILACRTEKEARPEPAVALSSCSVALQDMGTGTECAVEHAGVRPGRPSGNREILILIVGDGVMRETLEEQVEKVGRRHVRLMPLLAEAEYQGLLAASDISLILQAPGTGQYFLPSKLLSILSMGLPVLSAADDHSELAKAVAEGGFGVNIPPANPATLADTLGFLAKSLTGMEGLRLKTRWVERFSAATVLEEFERKLVNVPGAPNARKEANR